MSAKRARESKNLLNPAQLKIGYYAFTDGTRAYGNTWGCSGIMPVVGNTIYSFTQKTPSRYYGIVWWDSNGNFISSVSSQISQQNPTITATSPSSAAYAAVDIGGYPSVTDIVHLTELEELMFCEGNPQTYEPYGATIWEPCAVKRYTAGEEKNTLTDYSVTFNGLTMIKDRQFMKLEGTSTDAIFSTDESFRSSFNFKLKAGKVYIIAVSKYFSAEDVIVYVRYRNDNSIIVSSRDNPVATIAPNIDTNIYSGFDFPARTSAPLVNPYLLVSYRYPGTWHDTPGYVQENGVWVTGAIVSGTLPLTAVKTTGEDILNYKIYGASGGVGDNTINLCDGNFITGGGYWGASTPSAKRCMAVNLIAVEPLTTYTCAWTNNNLRYAIQQYGSTEKDLKINPCIKDSSWRTGTEANYSFTTEQNTHYIWLQFSSVGYADDVSPDDTKINLVAGSTAPAKYVPYGYEVDMSVSGWSPSTISMGKYINISTGVEISSGAYITSYFVSPIKGEIDIVIINYYNANRLLVYMPYDINGNALTSYGHQDVFRSIGTHKMTVTVPDDAATIGVSYINSDTDEHIIYTSPIYIGSSPLGEDEYVDYGKGKIYRMSGGVLTPTDPPVPLPALPTFSNTDTVINYENIPAPSSAEIKYKRRW